jgi:integrase
MSDRFPKFGPCSPAIRNAVATCSRSRDCGVRKHFRTACKALGADRLEILTIHRGRHTFISHALAGCRTLAEIRDDAGHANVSITSGYLNVAVDDEAAVVMERVAFV